MSSDESDSSTSTLVPKSKRSTENSRRSWDSTCDRPPTQRNDNIPRSQSTIPWDKSRDRNLDSNLTGLDLCAIIQSSEPDGDWESAWSTVHYDAHNNTITESWDLATDVSEIVSRMYRAHSKGLPVPEVLEWGFSTKTKQAFITTSADKIQDSYNVEQLLDIYNGSTVLSVIWPQICFFIKQLGSIGLWHNNLAPSMVYVDRYWDVREIRGWECCIIRPYIYTIQPGRYSTATLMQHLLPSDISSDLQGLDLTIPLPRSISSAEVFRNLSSKRRRVESVLDMNAWHPHLADPSKLKIVIFSGPGGKLITHRASLTCPEICDR